MKILYAANDSLSSYLQLKRFLNSMVDSGHEIRIAGFRRSLREIDADYCLDPLVIYSIANTTLNGYVNEINTYKPDLVLSDLEFFTSYAAVECGIPFWLVSSSLFYEALSGPDKKATAPLSKYFKSILQKYRDIAKTQYQIHNAERKLIYSHLGDIPMRPNLLNGFEWVRPYYVKAIENYESPSFICKMYESDKTVIKYLSSLGDTCLFSPLNFEEYRGIQHYHINDDVYARKIANAYLFFCRGETSLIADAFYNGKYVLLFQNFDNLDSLTNYTLSEYYSYGEKVYSKETFDSIYDLLDKNISVDVSLNKKVKFLDEYIKEIK